MQKIPVDLDYLEDILIKLITIPSPSGFTDRIVHFVGEELQRIGLPFELTRRGAIRAVLKGKEHSPNRALVSHLDTLGAMVKNLKPNGRLEIVPIGTWSARFAEGARVTIYTDQGSKRGTVLPLKASGHTFNEEIDTQPVGWDNLEIRVDERLETREQLMLHGFHVGDYISIDPSPEITPNGYVSSRFLDNNAGVAVMLATARSIIENKIQVPIDCYFLFTIFEEVGSGASAVLHGDVTEMVSIDNGTPAPGQNSSEYGVTIAMMDSSGPFDYHLTHKLLNLCNEYGVPHQRDVFKYYKTDAASAIEAGNDIRTALVCFGVDASHGYERTHLDSLKSLTQLLGIYLQSPPTFKRDRLHMGPLKGFSQQPV